MDPEDAKIVTLARAARLRAYADRTGRPEGAAVRDTDGRTYAAANLEYRDPSLDIPALQAAVAAAVSSGVRTFEAAALVSDAGEPTPAAMAALREFGAGVPVYVAAPDGVVHSTFTT